MSKSDLRVGAKGIDASTSALHEHCFVFAQVSVGVENKQIFVSQNYSNSNVFLFENHGIGMIMV